MNKDHTKHSTGSNDSQDHDKPRESLTFLQMVGSILASFFGVQSSQNRDRDFALGKAKPFIMVGILMTAVWYGVIYLVVQLVLKK